MSSIPKIVPQLLKEKPRDLLLFFDRKSHYTVYGDDAVFVANDYFKTLASLEHNGPESLAVQNIQPGLLENILLNLLNEKQFKFEIWSCNSSSGKWERVRRGSPGHLEGLEDLFETIEIEAVDSVTLSVYIGSSLQSKAVGVALIDLSERTIFVLEFLDTDHFTNFENVVVQAPGIKECLLPQDSKNTDLKIVADILQRAQVAITPVKKSQYKANNIEQDLTRLIGNLTTNLGELELKNAMAALSCLLEYLEVLGDDSNHGKFQMKRLDLSRFMRLDAAAIEALKLLPSKRDANKNLNLFSLLNKTVTKMGARRLMNWTRQPLIDADEINIRLDLLDCFVQDSSFRSQLRVCGNQKTALLRMDYFLALYLPFSEKHSLKSAPDISRLLKKLQRKSTKLVDCVAFYYFLLRLNEVRAAFHSYSGSRAELLNHRYAAALDTLLEDFQNFSKMVETTIDLEAAQRHEYLIRSDFDEELGDLSNRMQSAFHSIQQHSEQIRAKLGFLKTFALESVPGQGYCFRVSRKDEKELRDSKLTHIVVDSRKDGVKFKTDQLRNLSENYLQLQQDYENKQQELVTSVLEVVDGYQGAMTDLLELITELDVFSGLAHVFSTAPRSYTRPIILPPGGNITLRQCRHACLELQDSFTFIPNDVDLRRGASEFQIITGPNMGGKSTYIRSVGVAILMAQMGCYVPCDFAEISVVDSILCRVGAGDSQSRGVSTFMAEMLETTSILETATPNSLLIIDELGRGTSTYDGFGLAWAISEEIVERYIINTKKSFCFFATHFHELTGLTKQIPGVINLHVAAKAEQNELHLLYRIEEGPCDQSFGIHVAEMANFPDHVIQLAKRKALELEDFNKGCGLPEVSTKRTKAQPNEMAAESILREFCSLPLLDLAPEESLLLLNNLREKILSNSDLIKSQQEQEAPSLDVPSPNSS